MEPFIILFVILAIVLIVFVGAGLRIVRPFEEGLIEFLGRYQRTVDPGLRWVLPFVKRLLKVDMREQVIDVPPQEVITKDNVVVTVDAVIYFEATDPVKLKYNISNFVLAVTKLAQTNLRNVVGDLQLDEALTSRELINAKLREILDDATDKRGTRGERGEIQRIEPRPIHPRRSGGREPSHANRGPAPGPTTGKVGSSKQEFRGWKEDVVTPFSKRMTALSPRTSCGN